VERLRENKDEEVAIKFIEGLLLTVVRGMNKWIQAEEMDYQIWLNGLSPLEEGETLLRELNIPEIGLHCLYSGVVEKIAKFDRLSIEGIVLVELCKGVNEAMFNLAMDSLNPTMGSIHFWGLRRYKNQAVWVKRPPTPHEQIHEAVLKMQNPE
jgi:hypothetical protein